MCRDKLIKLIPCCRRLALLTDRREMRTNVALFAPHLIAVRWREVICNRRLGWCCVHCDRTVRISFTHAHNNNLQMTAAWDSQNGCVSRKRGRAMAVTMASSQKVRRQKILKIFLLECLCRTERAAVRSPV